VSKKSKARLEEVYKQELIRLHNFIETKREELRKHTLLNDEQISEAITGFLIHLQQKKRLN
jgi:phage host-nuclease inhibitor protein Gam